MECKYLHMYDEMFLITQETSYCFQQDSYQDITLHFDESLSAAIVIFCIMSSTIKEPKTDLNKSNITKQSSLFVWSFSSNCNFTEWFYNTSESFYEAFGGDKSERIVQKCIFFLESK